MPTRSSTRALLVTCLGAAGLGGTCSEPPPYHDVSGGWVNQSWGPDKTVALEGGPEGTRQVDVDVAMRLGAAVPKDRTPLPVEGTICISEQAGLGGTYAIDPATSTWAGADYGGARLDASARASDGRRVSIAQAHMYNASPDQLDNAILSFTAADGTSLGTIRFEGFRRDASVSCP
jgi:hypothetical protein